MAFMSSLRRSRRSRPHTRCQHTERGSRLPVFAGRAPELRSVYPVAVAPGMSVEYKGDYRESNPPLDHFRALGFGDGYQCSLSDPNVRRPHPRG